ncbi:MAG: hypothetical protein U0T81_14330 [Saprospiraceae bacterium]
MSFRSVRCFVLTKGHSGTMETMVDSSYGDNTSSLPKDIQEKVSNELDRARKVTSGWRSVDSGR